MNREQIESAACDYASRGEFSSYGQTAEAFAAGVEYATAWTEITPDAPATMQAVVLRRGSHQWIGARDGDWWLYGYPVWTSDGWTLKTGTRSRAIPTQYRPLPTLEDAA